MAAAGHQVVVADDLGADEAAFDVGMDLAGRLRRLRAATDRPGPDFRLAGGEEMHQPQQFIGGFDQFRQPAFRQTQVAQERCGLVVRQLGDFRLDPGGNDDHFGVFCRTVFADLRHMNVGGVLAGFVFADIGGVHDRLQRQQVHVAQQGLLLFLQPLPADRHAVGQAVPDFFQQLHLGQNLLVAAFQQALRFVEALLHRFDVGQAQFRVDDLDIPHRIDVALDMGDIRVGEAAHDLQDGVHLADMGQKLVAQAFAGRGALDQAGDVDELHRRGRGLLRLEHLGQFSQPLVRHFHDPDIRLDRAERIVGGLRPGFGDRVEQGAFADIRQADDADLKGCAHSGFSFFVSNIFSAFSNFGRGTSTRRPQPRHLIPISMPVRTISQRSEPQGCAFFILAMSPSSSFTGIIQKFLSA